MDPITGEEDESDETDGPTTVIKVYSYMLKRKTWLILVTAKTWLILVTAKTFFRAK
jgi:hypothetical protein